MPRFFFNVSGLKTVVDKDGVDLVDEDAAWSEAVEVCGQLLFEIDGRLPERSEVAIRVADEHGQHVATLRFVGRRQQEVPLRDVTERVADQVDMAIDWIQDVHGPRQINDYAHDLGLAALAGLQDGDIIGRGLVVRRGDGN